MVTRWRFNFSYWWEVTAKTRWPVLKLCDQTYDQSHDHHTFLTNLLAGLVMIAWGVWERFSLELFGVPYAWGITLGIVAYIGREVHNRFSKPTPLLWDQILDVLKQAAWLGPYALSTLVFGPLPWQTGAMLFVLTGITSYLYTWGRWPGRLHYDPRKDH